MSYHTMAVEDVFEELARGLPKFADGRVDYTHARKAPVVSVVTYHDGHILLVKRSHEVLAHRGIWSGVSGFIDEPRSLEDFAKQELREEIACGPEFIRNLSIVEVLERTDPVAERDWLVYVVLAELHEKPEVKLDWEHTEFAWVKPEALADYDTVDNFGEVVERALRVLT